MGNVANQLIAGTRFFGQRLSSRLDGRPQAVAGVLHPASGGALSSAQRKAVRDGNDNGHTGIPEKLWYASSPEYLESLISTMAAVRDLCARADKDWRRSEEIRDIVHIEVERVIAGETDRPLEGMTRRIGEAIASTSRERAESLLSSLVDDRSKWPGEALADATMEFAEITEAGGKADRGRCQQLNNKVSMHLRQVSQLYNELNQDNRRLIDSALPPAAAGGPRPVDCYTPVAVGLHGEPPNEAAVSSSLASGVHVRFMDLMAQMAACIETEFKARRQSELLVLERLQKVRAETRNVLCRVLSLLEIEYMPGMVRAAMEHAGHHAAARDGQTAPCTVM